MWKAADIQSIEEDEGYAQAKAAYERNLMERLALETEEKRLREIMARARNGARRGPDPTDEEINEAYERLQPPDASIVIPTSFILPAAHDARKREPALHRVYRLAKESAQRRLHAAG